MRHLNKKTIDLALAVGAMADQPGQQLTLQELVRAYCVAKCDNNDLRLKKWLDAFGHQSAWSISPEQLEVASQAMLEHGYAPATANRDLSSLGSVYKWARERRLAPRGFKSPTLGVKRFDEPIRRVHIDKDMLDKLKQGAMGFRNRQFAVFVALLIDTGARKSELLLRRGKDVNLDQCEILAPTTKNGTPRVLFFSKETAQLMRRVYGKLDPDALLFKGRVPDEAICFRRAWSILTVQVGLPTLRMHDVRHAAAANLLRAGVTLGVAAQVLGHDPAVLARRYGHLETGSLRAAQEKAWSLTTTRL